MYSAPCASSVVKIWWMARGITPAASDRSKPSSLLRAPPCRSPDKRLTYSWRVHRAAVARAQPAAAWTKPSSSGGLCSLSCVSLLRSPAPAACSHAGVCYRVYNEGHL